jgi:glutamate formiminotransferase / 5-formyltetrahydrofolate cyclo-ligase
VCAANVSEGRDAAVLAALRTAAGDALLDVHVDGDHHRSVLTMAGAPGTLVDRVLALASVAASAIDLGLHRGAHPRLGALDVVPFAPIRGVALDGAMVARESTIAALGALGIPAFRYGPLADGSTRSLPEVRRGAFRGLDPDAGPPGPHLTAGATAVGARRPLVAWNAWLHGALPAEASRIAAAVRGPRIRALGFEVTGATQVSCNLLDPVVVTPLDCYRLVEAQLGQGIHVVRCELVGLVPEAVLEAVPPSWWERLDLDATRTVEARAQAVGIPLA